MKISLCMICGNEAAILPRCLESAKAAFDELCLVRAVGSLDPDETVDRARAWCEANGKGFRFESFTNFNPFPHVDNFGAARNLSFSLATGDWLLWLDCDDYLDEINCRRIREAVATCPEDWNGIFASYLVEQEGGVILRERLIRQGKGSWRNAIHEDCEIAGKAGECSQIQVFHSGGKEKRGSSASRNLAILEREVQWAPRHYFYLHAELKTLQRPDEARAAGLAALVMLKPDRVEERYVVLLNLSELEPEKRIEHLLAAVRVQPHRREAFAYLCQKSIIDGNRSDAISYFRLLDCLPTPAPLPWTHQGLWYPLRGGYGGPSRTGQEASGKQTDAWGWGRNMLRVRVLKIAGQDDQAERELVGFKNDPEFAARWEEFSK